MATLAHVNLRFAVVRQTEDGVFINPESKEVCKELIEILKTLQKRIDNGEAFRDADEVPHVVTGNPETIEEQMNALGAQMETLSHGKLRLTYISEPLQKLRLPLAPC